MNFLHTYIPNSIFLDLGFIKIHWYGVLIAIGVVIGMAVVIFLAKQYKIPKEKIYDLAFWVILIGLIFDRLYYVIYAWPFYKNNLLDIFKVWEGGMAIHGGIIGGVFAIYLFSKKYKLNWRLIADLAIMALFIGLMIGRWGNYFNQELFGKPAFMPWGIPIAFENRPLDYNQFEFFHPTFLYESILDFISVLILLGFHFLRVKGRKFYSGNIALCGIIMYSLIRFNMEFLRLDYSATFGPLRVAQVASIVLILLSIVLYSINIKKYEKETLAN